MSDEFEITPPASAKDRRDNIFGDTTAEEWYDWVSSVEIRLTRQGKMVAGIGLGLGVVTLITLVEGRTIVRLVQSLREIVDMLNGDTTPSTPSPKRETSGPAVTVSKDPNVKLVQPDKSIDLSKVKPVDEELLGDLTELLNQENKDQEYGRHGDV